MKTYTLDELQDKFIGPVGMPKRDKFEYDLQMDSLGSAIKQARKEQQLTQEELGKLIGVQKGQISKLENKTSNAKISFDKELYAHNVAANRSLPNLILIPSEETKYIKPLIHGQYKLLIISLNLNQIFYDYLNKTKSIFGDVLNILEENWN